MNKALEKEIQQALARGYTHKDTEDKVLDPTLIFAMSDEVFTLITARDKELVEKLEFQKQLSKKYKIKEWSEGYQAAIVKAIQLISPDSIGVREGEDGKE